MLATASQGNQAQQHGRPVVRTYRPRTRRSCDFCRSRKSACRFDQGPPCYACRLYNRQCIISERPPRKRQRSIVAEAISTIDSNISQTVQINDSDKTPSTQADGSPPQVLPADVAESVTSAISGESVIQTDQARVLRGHDIPTEPLDAWSNRTAFLLGDTGESDPYLLRHFSSDNVADANDASKVFSRHMLRAFDPDVLHSSGKPLIMSVADHSLYDRGEPRLEQAILDDASEEVSRIISHDTGVRLVKLFFRYIYPYFPVVSKTRLLYPSAEISQQLTTLSLSLKAAIYASALAFFMYDNVLAATLVHSPPSSQRLYRIAWLAVTHEVHTPHLSTLQACLLLLQRVNDDRYVMDTVFRWSLLGWTVALAQTFGLSTDCIDWIGIPDWEKRLRRRLWWAVFVMDKWAFMSAGLSSHIHDDDTDVSSLTWLDFVYDADVEPNTAKQDGDAPLSHFYHLTRLTVIIAEIQSSFFTIAASKRTQRDLTLSIELAKPFRQHLKEWTRTYNAFLVTQGAAKSHTQPPRSGLDGNASLGLCYRVANIVLFRALLRPIESSMASMDGFAPAGSEAVRIGAKTCCVEAVDFVESLQRNVWDAFWHSWSRAGFAMISSMLTRLRITSEDSGEVDEINSLTRRWRWALRTGSGSAGNVLTSLALLRLDRSLVTRGIHESDEEG